MGHFQQEIIFHLTRFLWDGLFSLRLVMKKLIGHVCL